MAKWKEIPVDVSMTDMVNSPPHYNTGHIECIDAIRAALGPEGFVAYCQGNAIKYLWRFRYKGRASEDLDKAIWYTFKCQDANAELEGNED